jgi:hypothetical protein
VNRQVTNLVFINDKKGKKKNDIASGASPQSETKTSKEANAL